MNDSAVAAVQVAIQKLAEERIRLNTAFEQLSTTIKLLDPQVTDVGDDGTIHYENGRAVSAPIVRDQPPAKVPPGPTQQTIERAEWGTNLQKVRDAFTKDGTWYSVTQLSIRAGVKKSRASEVVARLLSEGYIEARGQAGTQDRQYRRPVAAAPEPTPAPEPVTPPKPPPPKPPKEAAEWKPVGDTSKIFFGDPSKIKRQIVSGREGRATTVAHFTEKRPLYEKELRLRGLFDYLVDVNSGGGDVFKYPQEIAADLGYPHAKVGNDLRELVNREIVRENKLHGYYGERPKLGGRPSHAYYVSDGDMYIDLDGNVDPDPPVLNAVTPPPKKVAPPPKR